MKRADDDIYARFGDVGAAVAPPIPVRRYDVIFVAFVNVNAIYIPEF